MKTFPVEEGVPGFLATGVSSGVKKNGSKDLGLLLGTRPCSVAGVFTNNRVKAAPVLLCKRRIERARCGRCWSTAVMQMPVPAQGE